MFGYVDPAEATATRICFEKREVAESLIRGVRNGDKVRVKRV
jgi:hypothetical protein